MERSREGRTRSRGGMLVAALKSRYFRHRCYRCFLHSVSSVTINEVTDQSGAGIVGRGVSLRCARMLLRCGDFIRRNWDNAARGLYCLAFILSELIVTLERNIILKKKTHYRFSFFTLR